MYSRDAAQAVRDHFRQGEVLRDDDWRVSCPAVPRRDGVVRLEMVLRGYPGGIRRIDLATMDTNPRGTGLGAEAMHALAAYCRPRSIAIELHALVSSASFFRRFDWLTERGEDSGDFLSNW